MIHKSPAFIAGLFDGWPTAVGRIESKLACRTAAIDKSRRSERSFSKSIAPRAALRQVAVAHMLGLRQYCMAARDPIRTWRLTISLQQKQDQDVCFRLPVL